MKRELIALALTGIIGVICWLLALGILSATGNAGAESVPTQRLGLVGSNQAGGMAGGAVSGGYAGANIRVAQY